MIDLALGARDNLKESSPMSTLATALTTWEEFLDLPNPEDGSRYELHDGEVVVVPPPRHPHVRIQNRLLRWFITHAAGAGLADKEFPYRPVANLQHWVADVAYIPIDDWRTIGIEQYPIYAPPLIVEVLSTSNRPEKIVRQRLAAFSGGTREFWVIDAAARTIEVSVPGTTSRVYAETESLPVGVLPGILLPVHLVFEEE